MLHILLGADWVSNRDAVLAMLANDVKMQHPGRVLIVPELISHDTERRLCVAAGDTTSRYAEVLTFTRLARRVCDYTAHAMPECLDDGGRLVAMAAAVHQVQSKLKAYASVETKPEFLLGLLDMTDEFKRCCITSKDLMTASANTDGLLAQKLEELALILESYESVCIHGKRDPRDQMNWVLEELEACDYANKHVFYVDGFPDFTRQHMEILSHLVAESTDVYVSLNCDDITSSNLAFEKPVSTARELLAIAKRANIPVEIRKISPRNNQLQDLCMHLFQGPVLARTENISAFRAESIYQECMETAQRILHLVSCGERYRNIGVVCADFVTYRNVLDAAFHRCRIPSYISGTESVLEKTLISTVIAAIDTAMSGFEQRDVLRYLKTSLSPLDTDVCDRLENYVLLWGINGKAWINPWKNHPEGLGETWTDAAVEKLNGLNADRELAITPLVALRQGLLSARNVAQQVESVYRFFEDVQLSQKLTTLADLYEERGDHRNAQILDQLWEILIGALEQLHDTLGKTVWDSDTFSRLLRLLIGQYSVGTIPAVLDSVTVGPVSAMRCQEVDHLFMLGAKEGVLPGYGGSAGVLTGQERTALRAIGLPLTGGAMDSIQAEFFDIYGVFCGAREKITVSCTAEQPSYVYQRLAKMASNEETVDHVIGAALTDRLEAAAYIARYCNDETATELGIVHEYNIITQKRDHELGGVEPDNVRALYGEKLRLSASQVDKQADCRLAYFLRYGLGVKERKPASIDPAEFGTYVHAVLENTVAEVMELGGFSKVTLEETENIAQKHSDAYTKERFSELETERMSYLFKRNSHELAMIVEELWRELRDASFVPKYFELQFGQDAPMPPIEIHGNEMDALLRGFVDRVDVWHSENGDFVRVVDYKTGTKDFDYCDVFNGLGLQMLLYLFALEENGHDLIGNTPIPAGVQYFPARAPMLSADGLLDEQTASAARNSVWKRRGLLLQDESVLAAMEPYDKPLRLSYSRKKDGSISGDLASAGDFQMLKNYIYRLLGKMTDEIASGYIKPNPYTRGASHDACRYCPYGAVCHVADVDGRRNYKAMSAAEFWDAVRKEMSDGGR